MKLNGQVLARLERSAIISFIATLVAAAVGAVTLSAQATSAQATSAQATGGAAAPSAPAKPTTLAPTTPSTPVPPAASSSVSEIGYLTAQQLAGRCQASDPASSSYCFAYIAAVADAARAYEIWLGAREFCLPSRIAQGDIRRAFMTYYSAYPSNGSGQAASVIINALKQTYPCD